MFFKWFFVYLICLNDVLCYKKYCKNLWIHADLMCCVFDLVEWSIHPVTSCQKWVFALYAQFPIILHLLFTLSKRRKMLSEKMGRKKSKTRAILSKQTSQYWWNCFYLGHFDSQLKRFPAELVCKGIMLKSLKCWNCRSRWCFLLQLVA